MNLIVYTGGMRAGVLDMKSGEPFYGFTYDERYLASKHPMPLSLSLPLCAERYDGITSLAFFEGLLPEGDARASVARQLGISERSPAKLLRALGKDCAGDIAVLEEDDPYQPPLDDSYGRLDNALERIAENPFGEIARLRAGNRLSLAGGQEKIALYHDDAKGIDEGWYVPLGGSPSTHIVKPQLHDAYPQLAQNEYLCMKLAKAVGINVADVDLVANEARAILVVRRYDREKTALRNEDGLVVYRRRRQEDFCQALGFDSSRKYENDGGPGIADMVGLLMRHSDRFLLDRASLLQVVMFNYLVGNCDAHAKNYSIMLGKAGSARLAPAYDLLSTTVYDGTFGSELSRGMGMKVGAHSNIDRITREGFYELGSSVGVSGKRIAQEAVELADGVLACFEAVVNDLAESSPDDVSELAERIRLGVERRARVFNCG